MIRIALVAIVATLQTPSFAQSHAMGGRKPTQAPPSSATVAPMPSQPPPPPGPPPDYIDDDTEFDDGDDLPPDNYAQPMQPRGGLPGNPGYPQPPPLPGQMPNQVNHEPPPRPMPTYDDNRPKLNGSKLHFRVVRDEFWEKGKKRERGRLDQ